MHPLETYLRDLHDIRVTGVAVQETSFYLPLANLLNAVGPTLKPRVRCIIKRKIVYACLVNYGDRIALSVRSRTPWMSLIARTHGVVVCNLEPGQTQDFRAKWCS